MTLRTWARLALVAVTAAALQVALLNGLVVEGAHVDLWLVLTIAAGLVAGPQRGAVFGFLLGLFGDLFVQTPYGLSSLCFVFVAFGVGMAASMTPGRPPISFRLSTALLGGIGGTVLYAGLATLIGQPSLPRRELLAVVVVVALGCVVLIVPAYKVLEWILTVAPGSQREPGGFAARSTR